MHPEYISGDDIYFGNDLRGIFLRNEGGNSKTDGTGTQAFRTSTRGFRTYGALLDRHGNAGPSPSASKRNALIDGNAYGYYSSANSASDISGDVETAPINITKQLYTIVDTYAVALAVPIATVIATPVVITFNGADPTNVVEQAGYVRTAVTLPPGKEIDTITSPAGVTAIKQTGNEILVSVSPGTGSSDVVVTYKEAVIIPEKYLALIKETVFNKKLVMGETLDLGVDLNIIDFIDFQIRDFGPWKSPQGAIRIKIKDVKATNDNGFFMWNHYNAYLKLEITDYSKGLITIKIVASRETDVTDVKAYKLKTIYNTGVEPKTHRSDYVEGETVLPYKGINGDTLYELVATNKPAATGTVVKIATGVKRIYELNGHVFDSSNTRNAIPLAFNDGATVSQYWVNNIGDVRLRHGWSPGDRYDLNMIYSKG
jgi:hypothetical protein